MILPAHGLSVAIMDTNPLLADGIGLLLRQDPGLVSRTVFVGPDAEDMDDDRYDVVIVDPAQSEMSPADLGERLGSRAGAILGYSSAVSERLARACISAGFRGILPKTVPFETLKIALATTAQGGIYIDAAFATAITPESDSVGVGATKSGQDVRLSAREMFVLKSVAHGKSMKEIGNELDLSSKTVETYKARGASKLNLSGRRQIVEFAIDQGWV
ncbi:MAG: response regulator transcription factor [Proteobacteria bacterium]|nr:MAG: response regulator transcription factor [Pseudomonadota bacterium]